MKRSEKKLLAYFLWFIVSIVLLVVVRDIARNHFPEQSRIIMGGATVNALFVLFYIKDRLDKSGPGS